MNLPWFRLYTEFAADPKIQILAFEDQRHYVMLLCLKGNGTLDAQAPSETYRERLIAKALGLDPASSAEAKRRLMEGGLIGASWQPVKWDSRQFQSDYSTLRVQKYREKQKGNVTETFRKRSETVRDSEQIQIQNRRDTEQTRGDARGGLRAARSAACRLPEDFALTPERKAVAEGEHVDAQRTFATFVDYWRGASGEKARKHDWDATWRNWCRRQSDGKKAAAAPARHATRNLPNAWRRASMDKRAERVWLRLIQAYGSRVAESYGPTMPKIWTDAVEELSDDQIVYGLRKVVRDTPIHPPTLGQFVAACVDMPQVHTDSGPTIQAQLSAYVMLEHFPKHRDGKFTPDQTSQASQPWTYLYREWIDENRPKHMQKCAECTGVLIPAAGDLAGFRVSVADMLADKAGHARAMRSFEPGPRPTRDQRSNWLDATIAAAQKKDAERRKEP